GAELTDEGVHFRVWAPERRAMSVVIEGDEVELARDGEYFAGLVRDVNAGARYRFRLDGDQLFPDPASRFQPEGPHGPSMVIDPAAFQWQHDWNGIEPRALY